MGTRDTEQEAMSKRDECIQLGVQCRFFDCAAINREVVAFCSGQG